MSAEDMEPQECFRCRETRILLKTARTFLACDPDAVDRAVVETHGLLSEDCRSLIELIDASLGVQGPQ